MGSHVSADRQIGREREEKEKENESEVKKESEGGRLPWIPEGL